MRRIWVWGLLVAIIAGLVLSAGPVSGQTVELKAMTVTIPIDNIVRGISGESILVATEPLPEGLNCVGVLKTDNNESVHAEDLHAAHGTNIIMVSATSVKIWDVEVSSYESRSLALRSGIFESDGSVRVFVQVGHDKVSSTGFDLVIDCGTPPTTTTTTPPGETTTTTGPTVSTSSSIPTGIPSGVGPVEDGLSPAATWAWLIVFSLLFGGLVWVFLPKLWSHDD